MPQPETMLERRIASALNERADSLSSVTFLALDPVVVVRPPARRRGAVFALAAVVAVAIVVAVVKTFAGDGGRPSSPPVSITSTPSSIPAQPTPAGVSGPEVPIYPAAETKDTLFLIKMAERNHPDLPVFALQSLGSPPIVFSGTCMTIASVPASGAGYQGTCAIRDAATRVIGTVDTGTTPTATPVTYGAWVAVPPGTAYVTYSYGGEQAWQRPVNGVSFFSRPGALITNHRASTVVVFRAFKDDGTQLGEARA